MNWTENKTNAAIFLDRDGVIIRDIHLLTQCDQIELLSGAVKAIDDLKQAGYIIIVVSNQTVVARGLATEQDVEAVHRRLQQMLIEAGGERIDAFYFCPHHPEATLPQYRVLCECRKPRPGMLLRAAREHSIDLKASYMIGDRITDIVAGQKAGCKTILVESGRHLDPPIESPDPIDRSYRPDRICSDLRQAAGLIVRGII